MTKHKEVHPRSHEGGGKGVGTAHDRSGGSAQRTTPSLTLPLKGGGGPIRIAALISGGGRTLMNIADRIDNGSLNATIQLVIASRPGIAGIEKAKARGFNVRIASRQNFSNEDSLHQGISAWLGERAIDLVCLCGYLRIVRIDEAYRWRVINIHPALLPEFGGQGMYGERVHRAVLAAGRSVSGCTVHFVDELYDHGPIILQRTCPVLPDDDEHTLAARVFEEERIAYPEAIGLFAAGRLRVAQGRVQILPGDPPAAVIPPVAPL